ncbi:MAG: thiamine biosynthesis protein ThiS [Planctomycetes bacterium RBG_16_59_8]|nr:MAG: thiamine biosynthesis protein ThiS [Planctomycetes bacterium RBG_16_59_8]
MNLTVNGEKKNLPDGATVRRLLIELGLEHSPVAVEVNRKIVRRGDQEGLALSDGDTVEVVHFVGGG